MAARRSSPTAPAPSGPSRRARPRTSSSRTPDVEVTVGISGTGGGFERFCRDEIDLANASRPIDDDERAAVRRRRRRVRRAARRERRAHRGRQPRERLGDVPDRRAAEGDLGARLDDRELAGRRPELPRRAASALRAGHGLRHVRLLHRRRRRRGGREPHRLSRPRRTTTSRSPASPETGEHSDTSASRTTSRTRTR